ncbi:MAG: hypothetical protein KJ970_03530 [Candidatus Eisenbacteria bacterium]|uniref:Uncharacterized protein n=1 Tax=Eiseniibacteriota bacterium TaxID=2212470 RepID=A0A948RV16_UNCEI|nr:hypothetical protein [Candidatus Eisenbacteria bacterium]MBU1950262.1 hypothetical protein [Candidatus Eisenbacteria bacterium]MBU2689972.1 hypothetical protein [Candidatus Eisenbacteria bacterium]
MRFTILLIMLIGISAAPVAAEFPSIAGWIPSGDSENFGPGNLWEVIDGAADQFLAYGFQELDTAELSQGGVSATVELYNMGSCLNAFGIYRLERSGSAETIKIGAEGAASPPYQWLMFKDRTYVKVEASGGEMPPAAGLDLLRKIAAALPGTDELPQEFNRLPAQGRIAGSIEYTRESFLGLRELRNCLHALYKYPDGGRVQYFHIVPGAGEDHQVVWSKLSAKWKAETLDGRLILLKEIPYKGTIGITSTSRGILGVARCKDRAELLKILKGLPL